jgi:hypothetical protein
MLMRALQVLPRTEAQKSEFRKDGKHFAVIAIVDIKHIQKV